MRKCNCSGFCGPQSSGLSRREFLELTAAGVAGTYLVGRASAADFNLPDNEYTKWKTSLFAPDKPRVYLSGKQGDARMHLGGIGTGNVEIGSDGQLTTWQLFNTLLDGYVPLHFCVKVGGVTRLLQTGGGIDVPRVKQIEMTGDYPIASLKYIDPELPVEIGLDAFSPFAPLDTKLSSTPLAALVFRVKNPTNQAQTVSLAGFMQNPVGYEANGQSAWAAGTHPDFGFNVNEPLVEGRAHGLCFHAENGHEPTLDKPVLILAGANLKNLKHPLPEVAIANLTVHIAEMMAKPEQIKEAPLANTVIWLEETPADVFESYLLEVRDLVKEGATLVFSGKTMPLLSNYATTYNGKPPGNADLRPDIVFEDFEGGYEKWKIEGTAFGTKPVQGTVPGQQQVTGYVGKGLVNSYLNGDAATGKLTSNSFTIERNFIRFLIGAGRFENTQIRLLVDDKIVRKMSGKDSEHLDPALWDVREFMGKNAHIEIVDEEAAPWGHISVDHIVFSDEGGNRAVLALLEEMLPARFSGIQEAPAKPGNPHPVVFQNVVPREGAVRSKAANGLDLLAKPLGKGRVVLAAGSVIDPSLMAYTSARQQAYALLCSLVGAKLTLSGKPSSKAPGFGTLALATLAGEPSVLLSFTDWMKAWQQFTNDGHFTPFTEVKGGTQPTQSGQTVNGALATSVVVPAGQTVEIPFLLTWHYPNKYSKDYRTWIGCHYTTLWPNARGVMKDAVANFSAWRAKTELFRSTFYDSTLPWWMLDCITANAAIIRHIGVVFRIANGDCYGWEGSNGCCDPTCTHVWGYEQTLARLFPDMERDMRRIDFKRQQRADGGVNNRVEVPSPPQPSGEQPFADGHASCVLKAYREALNAPDDGFFKDYWPQVKLAVDYLIGRDAKSHGNQPAGYLEDDQFNTYDEAVHGVNTFISVYYLAALRAGEEWARRIGDTATADRFRAVFTKGQQKLVELCWNGEYFYQNLPGYEGMKGEVGPGCMADQLIGQWWAHQLGLGYILPKDKTQAALAAIFKYNFKSDLTGWRHAPRAFAGAKDNGLIICTWPKGGRPPCVMNYSDEVWTGIEYQVAGHMIYEGMIEEAFAIVKGVRERYDGTPRAPIQRSPWNEIECGGHYARAMASWSLLTGLSGWEYDGLSHLLHLTPRRTPENFRSFFAAPQGWGSVYQMSEGAAQKTGLIVKLGGLLLKSFDLALLPDVKPSKATVTLAGKSLSAKLTVKDGRAEIVLGSGAVVREGESLEIMLS